MIQVYNQKKFYKELVKIFTYVKNGKKIDEVKYKQYLNGIPNSIWTGRRVIIFIIKNEIKLDSKNINFPFITKCLKKLINEKYQKSPNFDILLKKAMMCHNSKSIYKLEKLNRHILSI